MRQNLLRIFIISVAFISFIFFLSFFGLNATQSRVCFCLWRRLCGHVTHEQSNFGVGRYCLLQVSLALFSTYKYSCADALRWMQRASQSVSVAMTMNYVDDDVEAKKNIEQKRKKNKNE